MPTSTLRIAVETGGIAEKFAKVEQALRKTGISGKELITISEQIAATMLSTSRSMDPMIEKYDKWARAQAKARAEAEKTRLANEKAAQGMAKLGGESGKISRIIAKTSTELSRFISASLGLKNSLTKSSAEMSRFSRFIRGLGVAANRTIAKMYSLARAMKTLSMGGAGGIFRRNIFARAMDDIVRFSAAYLGLQSIIRGSKMVADLQDSENALNVAADGLVSFAEAGEVATGFAEKFRVSLEVAETATAGFYRLAQAGVITINEVSKATDNMGAIFLRFGTDAEGQKRALYGLQQVLTSSRVTMEDAKQVWENVPGLQQAMGAAINGTAQDIRELVLAGQAGREFFDIFSLAGEQSVSKLGAVQNTWRREFTRTKVSLQLLLKDFDKAGLRDFGINILSGIGDFVRNFREQFNDPEIFGYWSAVFDSWKAELSSWPSRLAGVLNIKGITDGIKDALGDAEGSMDTFKENTIAVFTNLPLAIRKSFKYWDSIIYLGVRSAMKILIETVWEFVKPIGAVFAAIGVAAMQAFENSIFAGLAATIKKVIDMSVAGFAGEVSKFFGGSDVDVSWVDELVKGGRTVKEAFADSLADSGHYAKTFKEFLENLGGNSRLTEYHQGQLKELIDSLKAESAEFEAAAKTLAVIKERFDRESRNKITNAKFDPDRDKLRADNTAAEIALQEKLRREYDKSYDAKKKLDEAINNIKNANFKDGTEKHLIALETAKYDKTIAGLNKVSAAAKKAAKDFQALYDEFNPIQAAVNDYDASMESLEKNMAGLSDEEYQNIFKGIEKTLKKAKLEANGFKEAIDDINGVLDEHQGEMDPLGKIYADHSKKIKEITDAYEKHGKRLTDTVGPIEDVISKQNELTNIQIRDTTKIDEVYEELGDTLSEFYYNALTDADDWLENLKETMVRGFADILAEMTASAILKPFENWVGNLFVGGGGGGGGGGGVGGRGVLSALATIVSSGQASSVPTGRLPGGFEFTTQPTSSNNEFIQGLGWVNNASSVYSAFAGGGGLTGGIAGGVVGGLGSLFAGTSFGAGLTAAGTALGSGTYLAGFLPQSIFSGIQGAGAAYTAGGVAGSGAGSFIGYAAPYIAAVIAIAAYLGNKKPELRESGVELFYGGQGTDYHGNANAQFFAEYHGKSWFRSTSDTVFTPAEEDMIQGIDKVMDSGMDKLIERATALGVQGADAILAGFKYERRIDLGKEWGEEELAKAIEDWVVGALGEASKLVFKGTGAGRILEGLEGEDLNSAVNDINYLVDYFTTSISEAFEVTLESSAEILDRQNQGIEKLIENFDYSIEQTAELSAKVKERFQTELKYLAQIKSAAESINTTIDTAQRGLKFSLLDDAGKDRFLRDENLQLTKELYAAQTPEEVESISKRISANTLARFNLIPDDEQNRHRRETFARDADIFLEGIRVMGNTSLGRMEDDVVSGDEQNREDVSGLLGASEASTTASENMTTAANEMSEAARGIPPALADVSTSVKSIPSRIVVQSVVPSDSGNFA